MIKILLNGFKYFFGFFVVVFRHKICDFIIFISFFDEVSNFRIRILTNQKHELVVSSCQWNCMLGLTIKMMLRDVPDFFLKDFCDIHRQKDRFTFINLTKLSLRKKDHALHERCNHS